MAQVQRTQRFLRYREASASLLILTFLFFLSAPAAANIWLLNDAQTEGDILTRAAGNDQSGNGTAAQPFRTLQRALRAAKEGDTIRLDTGNYDIPATAGAPAEMETVPITLSQLTLEGVGPDKTLLRAMGKNGLVFAGAQGLQLREFRIEGGACSLLLDRCRNSTLRKIETRHSVSYGILLKDSQQIKIEACRTESSRFRGLQLRRSRQNTVLDHLSVGNANTGICLENADGNLLKNCLARGNGMSGFYLFEKSHRNHLEKCRSERNKFVGFYLDSGSTQNELRQNHSRFNERGYTLKRAPDNILNHNQALSNQTSGFWIKEKSPGTRLEENLAQLNGAAGFIFSPDSPPLLFSNNPSRKNKNPDQLVQPKSLAHQP